MNTGSTILSGSTNQHPQRRAYVAQQQGLNPPYEINTLACTYPVFMYNQSLDHTRSVYVINHNSRRG